MKKQKISISKLEFKSDENSFMKFPHLKVSSTLLKTKNDFNGIQKKKENEYTFCDLPLIKSFS